MTGGLPARPGTYILVLVNRVCCTVKVGGLGRVEFHRGWYLYTGSAFGPGGLAARAGRHLRPDKPCRWHIDYLTAGLTVHRVWLSTATQRLECLWAGLLTQMGGTAVPGFGASDCDCPGHLFYFSLPPSFYRFRTHSPHPVRSVRPVMVL